jgi:hypothetical protein
MRRCVGRADDQSARGDESAEISAHARPGFVDTRLNAGVRPTSLFDLAPQAPCRSTRLSELQSGVVGAIGHERSSRACVVKGEDMRSALVAIVLMMNFGGGDGSGTLAGRDISVLQSSGPRSATQEVALPDLQGFPTAPAPDQLSAVPLPDTVGAVKALFERLPSEVAGHVRSPQFDRISPERASVGYGDDPRISGVGTPLLWLQAIDLSRGGLFPTNWTGGHVVAFMARGKEAREAGRDGDLFWIRQETFRVIAGSPERFAVHGTLWGRVDSSWMFSIQADTRENRDALLVAFVAAARSSPR